MKRIALITTAAVTVLAGCSNETSQTSEEFISVDSLKEMSKLELEKCIAWAEYDDISQDEVKYPGVLFCTTAHTPIFMYKGVFTETLTGLTLTDFYRSGGENMTEVARVKIHVPAYEDGKYTIVLNEDETAKFSRTVTENDAEGVLATSDELDATEWIGTDEDSEVLIAESGGHAMFMGAMFMSLAALQSSNYYKSRGSDRSGIAVPASYRSGATALAYSQGSYKPSNSSAIKGSSVRISSESPKTVSGATKGSTMKSFLSTGKSGISTGARGGGGS